MDIIANAEIDMPCGRTHKEKEQIKLLVCASAVSHCHRTAVK